MLHEFLLRASFSFAAQLTPIAESLNRDAWSRDEGKLKAEFATTAEALDKDSAIVLISSRAAPELLALNLKKARLDKGLTMEELAERAGLDKRTILRIENRHKAAYPDTLKKIADALGTTVSALLGIAVTE